MMVGHKNKENTIFEDCALFFIVLANSFIFISHAFAWVTYSFMDVSKKTAVEVGPSLDHGLPARLLMTFLLPVLTFMGIYAHMFIRPFLLKHLHDSFHILWLFNMIVCMRSVVGVSNYHIAVAVSLLLFPYVFIHPNLIISQIQLVALSIAQIVLSLVIFSENYGEFEYGSRNVEHTWLHMTDVNGNDGILTSFLISVLLSLLFFSAGVWLQDTYTLLTTRSVMIVTASMFLPGLCLSFFPVSLLLPVSDYTTLLLTSLRMIQFGCIMAANTSILSICQENTFRHLSKSCIVVVIGLILQSFVHETGDTLCLFRCLIVSVVIIIFNPLLSFMITS
jgi:hypothetical protein